MEVVTLEKELNSLAYHGRGIVIGKSADGKKLSSPTLLWAEAKTAVTEFL